MLVVIVDDEGDPVPRERRNALALFTAQHDARLLPDRLRFVTRMGYVAGPPDRGSPATRGTNTSQRYEDRWGQPQNFRTHENFRPVTL